MKQDSSNNQSKQQNNVRILLALCVIVVLTVFILWLKPNQQNQNATPHVKKQTTNKSQTLYSNSSNYVSDTKLSAMSKNLHADTVISSFKTGLENIPKSLQGTKIDGDIIIDENQQLVVTMGLRRLFDYFLTVVGEESTATINSRVEAYIISHTPEPAASQAVSIYHQYIGYLKAVGDLEKKFGSLQLQDTQVGNLDINLVKQRRNKTQKIRKQFFNDETIQAFFSTEDGLESRTLAMMAIQKNETLNSKQKQQSSELIIDRMPEGENRKAVESYLNQQATINQLIQQTNKLKAQGASKDELYNMRVQRVGEPAAIRLAKVDEENEDFDLRFIQYQMQKQQLLQEFKEDSDDYQKKVADVEKSLFNENEVKRLSAYEAIKKLK